MTRERASRRKSYSTLHCEYQRRSSKQSRDTCLLKQLLVSGSGILGVSGNGRVGLGRRVVEFDRFSGNTPCSITQQSREPAIRRDIWILYLLTVSPGLDQGRTGYGRRKPANSARRTSRSTPYDFCTAALKSRPASECQTLRGIGMACINLVMANVTDTGRHIKAVLNSGEVRPELRMCVDECSMLYNGHAITGAKEAMMNYKNEEYTNTYYDLEIVMDQIELCDDLFTVGSQDSPSGGCGGGFSPFSARNNDTMQLSGMAMAVMNLLQEGNVH
nr:putative invertase inhibitor [Ipomoea batatas]